MIRFKVNKNLYSRLVLLKAAYSFTDRYFIHLDMDKASYIIEITSKKTATEENLKQIFNNELLVQATRAAISEKTAHIRELILGRAFASTIIEMSSTNNSANLSALPLDSPASENNTTNNEISTEEKNLFMDWFGDES